MNELLALVERHRAIVLPASGSLLLMAVAVIGWQLAGSFSNPISPQRVPQAYFYDLHTGELFTAASDLEGPIETESGLFGDHPAVVRANVFSCGSCRDPNQRFVGWLEMPDPAAPEPSAEEQELPDPLPDDGEPENSSPLLIRAVDGAQWYSIDSPQAETIMREAEQRCREGETLRYCHPPSVLAD